MCTSCKRIPLSAVPLLLEDVYESLFSVTLTSNDKAAQFTRCQEFPCCAQRPFANGSLWLWLCAPLAHWWQDPMDECFAGFRISYLERSSKVDTGVISANFHRLSLLHVQYHDMLRTITIHTMCAQVRARLNLGFCRVAFCSPWTKNNIFVYWGSFP